MPALAVMSTVALASNPQILFAKRLIFPYHRHLAESGRTLATPAFTWPSKERQQVSHDAVLQFYDGGSVLDVGCGMGELSERISGHYAGVDLEEPFIERARLRYPHREFHCGSLNDVPPDLFDYVVAIGPLCYDQGGDREQDMEYFRGLLRGMYRCSRIATLVTISSDLAGADFQAERPELRFSNPGFWLAYASQLSRRLVLRHDYVASEFVLAIFREPTDWPRR